jgi:hypothetical protein
MRLGFYNHFSSLPFKDMELYKAVSYTHTPSPRDRTRSRMPSSA